MLRTALLLLPAAAVVLADVAFYLLGLETITAHVRAHPRAGYAAALVYGGLFVHFFLYR